MIVEKQNYWGIVLLALGAGILIFTLAYANYLAQNLKEREEKSINLYINTLEVLNETQNEKDSIEKDYTFYLQIIDSFNLPSISEDENGILEGRNFVENKNFDQEFLESKKLEFLKSGQTPLQGIGYNSYIYFFNSPLLTYIQLFPIVQVILVSLYILLGYYMLSSSKKAEQNRVWAGMAKETAHQLGTPISAIVGWIEYLKDSNQDKEETLGIVEELRKDVDRLELVADRFSKIGSEPVLQRSNIVDEVNEVKDYLQRRSPRKVTFEMLNPNQEIIGHINKHLFAWVIENLMRNSLDALDGEGKIMSQVSETEDQIIIEVSDTGHGIPSNKFKSIFKPGYSTKKRGWGLGLSLAKRIIEEYHKGKISVKMSKPGILTTFIISLPKQKG